MPTRTGYPTTSTLLLPQAVMNAKYSGAGSARTRGSTHSLSHGQRLGHLAGRHRFNRARSGHLRDRYRTAQSGRHGTGGGDAAPDDPRRAILGIGTGEREGNEPYGVDWSKPVARFEEALATIRALWNSNGQLVNRDSEWFPLRNASFRLEPLQGHLARDLDRVAWTADAARDGSLRRWVVPGRGS